MYDVFDRLLDQVLLWDLPKRSAGRPVAKLTAVSGGRRAFVGDTDTGILMSRDASGWSVSFAIAEEREFGASSRRLAVMYRELAERFRLTIVGIRRGRVTRENVGAILSAAQAPPGMAEPEPPEVEDVDVFYERRSPRGNEAARD
jgi:hypothetical protein